MANDPTASDLNPPLITASFLNTLVERGIKGLTCAAATKGTARDALAMFDRDLGLRIADAGSRISGAEKPSMQQTGFVPWAPKTLS